MMSPVQSAISDSKPSKPVGCDTDEPSMAEVNVCVTRGGDVKIEQAGLTEGGAGEGGSLLAANLARRFDETPPGRSLRPLQQQRPPNRRLVKPRGSGASCTRRKSRR